MVGGIAKAFASRSAANRMHAGAITGIGVNFGGGSSEARWHQITHLRDDVDSHNFEDPSNTSNFSDANHEEMNKKRLKNQMKISMMDRANVPVWMIEKAISEQEINQENAG